MSLKFGTSGIRGLVEEFSSAEVFRFIKAFIETSGSSNKVHVGMDYRESSPVIAQKVLMALDVLKIEWEFHGVLPTPCLAYYSMQNRELGIMVTGSHVPADRNGIKFYLPTGETLKVDEQKIMRAHETFQDFLQPSVSSESKGRVSLALNSPLSKAQQAYKNRYVNFFKGRVRSDLKVLLYEHSAAGREIIKEILEEIGCEVVCKGRSAQFVPVDTENLQSLEELREWTLNENADTLVSTDGDSDRPLILDDCGMAMRGDEIGMLLSQYLNIDRLAVPVSTLSSIFKVAQFREVRLTKIGSPFVIEGMRQLLKEHPEDRIAGFEANGGFLMESAIAEGGKSLEALETRDAVLPILGLLAYITQEKKNLSELRKSLPPTGAHSGLLKEIPSKRSQDFVNQAAKNPEMFVEKYLRFVDSPLKRINDLDGARFIFENGEIVHLRPSGNAPEFRCYTEANNVERAIWLNESILTQVQKELSHG